MGPEERISALVADKNINLDECAPLAVSLGGLSIKIIEPDEPDNEKNSGGEESAVRTLLIVLWITELNIVGSCSLFVYK